MSMPVLIKTRLSFIYQVEAIKYLVNRQAKTSKEVILALVHAYSHEIGSERLLELFETSKAIELTFLYLDAIVDASKVRKSPASPPLS